LQHRLNNLGLLNDLKLTGLAQADVQLVTHGSQTATLLVTFCIILGRAKKGV
jgi:hypothetical protein